MQYFSDGGDEVVSLRLEWHTIAVISVVVVVFFFKIFFNLSLP